jgi:hypothetical protein
MVLMGTKIARGLKMLGFFDAAGKVDRICI